MLETQRWGQGKDPATVYLAISYAILARTRCEALHNIKDRKVFGHKFPLPDLPSWFALYRSAKPLLAYRRLILHTSDFIDGQVKIFSSFRKLWKLLNTHDNVVLEPATNDNLKESRLVWQGMCAQLYDEITTDLEQKLPSPQIQEKFLNALVEDELSLGFYFLVFAPCLLLYNTSPSLLYGEALAGNISSMEKLLKLDSLVLHDPSIGVQIQALRLHGKINDYERLITAVIKCPTVRYQEMRDERRSIKSDHGATIYAFAKALNKPLTAPQIRELFDALAKDYEGTLVDTDIVSPESFDTTIRGKAGLSQKKGLKTQNQK